MKSKNTQKPAAKKQSMLGAMIPAVVKDTMGSVSRKQWLDICLFTGGLYCMYKFGGHLSGAID